MKLLIPHKENLIPIGYEYIDQTIDQYYRPLQGYFMRKRLELALSLLGLQKVDRILDAGYGGGTFLPTLYRLARGVYGIDTLPFVEKVQKILKNEGVKASLFKGSIFKMPFRDNFFDRVVCISVLEHFKGKQLNRSIREMLRVLKPGGYLVLGFPVKNFITDFIIGNFLKFNPNEIHPSGHKEIIGALKQETKIDKIIHYFPFLTLDLSLYCVVRVKKPKLI